MGIRAHVSCHPALCSSCKTPLPSSKGNKTQESRLEVLLAQPYSLLVLGLEISPATQCCAPFIHHGPNPPPAIRHLNAVLYCTWLIP